ncbi:MAG TPA: pitrilysin family protein [Kofleriaceae bacterium]|nr:pitrilysin family protein [Kofleriaceae bacterium]
MLLPNGLRALIAPSTSAPVVAVQAWIGVGSADEGPRQQGMAHVLEHMLFKGTARYGVGEIARTIESCGGEINAWTSFDHTVFHVVAESRHLGQAIEVLADAIQRPAFDPAELELEREVVLEEIRQTLDDPMRQVAQSLFSTAFARHPYRRPVIGNPASVRALTRAQVSEFHRAWYVANNLTLVITGDLEVAATERLIERAFADMPQRMLVRRPRTEPTQTRPRAVVHGREVHDAHVAIGFHVPGVTHDQATALDIGAIVLGQGESSRFGACLHRERELVSSAYAYAHTLRDRGMFVVSAIARPDQVREAVTEACAEIARLADEPPSDAELDRARHAIRAEAIYQRETAEGQARALGYYQALAGDPEHEAEILRRVHRLRPAEVADAARAWLRAGNASLAMVLPESENHDWDAEAEAMLDCLERGLAAHPRRARPSRAPALVRSVLSNGVRVIARRDASVPVVAMRAVWPGGVRHESERQAGVTNLLSSAITFGCGKLSTGQVIDAVDGLAGSLVGVSGRNTFGLRAEWLAPDWEQGFDLLSSCIREPRFEAAEIEREKRRIVDDLSARRDNASFAAFRAFAQTLYRRHPYRLHVLGSETSVSKLDRRRVREFYRRRYGPSDLTIVAVGDLDPDRFLSRAEELLGSIPERPGRRRTVPQEDFAHRSAEARRAIEHMQREQAHLVVGFPGLTIGDPDRPALEVLMTILGGQGGRLFLELRDRRALAYRVSAFSVEGIDPGYIAAYVACAPEKLAEARDAIRAELNQVIRPGVGPAEVQRAARYLVGTHQIALQRRASLAAAIALNEAYGVGHDYHERYAGEIEAVTVAEVARVARRCFDWDLAVTSIVTAPGGPR